MRRALAVVAGLALAVGVASACSPSRHEPPTATSTDTTPATSRAVPRTGPLPRPATGPLPPSSGSLLGAFVQPVRYTDEGLVDALTDYERVLGRPLAIVQDFHPWEEHFPSPFDRHVVASGSTLLLSWAGTDTSAIAAGRYDAMVRQRALALKALGKPVLLRWRWEMDRPNLQAEIGSPEGYVAAWRHLRSVFAAAGARNVGWVWCPLAGGFDTGRAPAYYPGDAQVDWLCADVYAGDPSVPFRRIADSFLGWAARHDRPIIFAEVGTQRVGTGARATWLRQAADWIQDFPQVKAFVYFDSDVDRDGRIRRWSLRNWPEDVAAFREIADRPYFRAQEPP